MKRATQCIFLLLILVISLAGCKCEHEWTKANCTTPKTCSLCEETEGEPAGHRWLDATCEDPEICSSCGQTQGQALGHHWQAADCVHPETCSICNKTQGDPLGHTWQAANCTNPKTCSVCSGTEGSVLGHDWIDATCLQPKTCAVCAETEGELGEHEWIPATYEEPATCSVCGETNGEPLIQYSDTILAVIGNYEQSLEQARLHNSDADYAYNTVWERLVNLVDAVDKNDKGDAQGYAWGLFSDGIWEKMSMYQLKMLAQEKLTFILHKSEDRLSALMRQFRKMHSVTGTISPREVDIEVTDMDAFLEELDMNARTVGQILAISDIYLADLQFTENGFTFRWKAIGEGGYELKLQ